VSAPGDHPPPPWQTFAVTKLARRIGSGSAVGSFFWQGLGEGAPPRRPVSEPTWPGRARSRDSVDWLESPWPQQVGRGSVGVIYGEITDAGAGFAGTEFPAEALKELGFAQASLGGVCLGVDLSVVPESSRIDISFAPDSFAWLGLLGPATVQPPACSQIER
jgi:hypothetical protein